MRIIWKGKFDGNEESLPHGEHKPNAVKFQEIDDIKKLGLVLNLLSVPLMIVTYAIVLLRGGFDVILEHFWIYWAGILAAIACLIPHEFIHAMCFRKKRKELAFHLYYATTHHTKMNHKKQRQFPDAVFVFSDAVHAFRIPGVKSFLSLCLIISIITRAIITEQMSAIGWAKIRPSSPTNALAINSTGRKTNP